MALDDIYRDLRDSILEQQIDLYTAAQQKSSLVPLREVLALFNINSTYILSNVKLAQPDAITLTGQGTWGLAGAFTRSNVTASLIVTMPGGQSLFTLTLAISDTNWTFSTTFQNLPQTQAINEDTKTVELGDSFLNNLPLANPVFSARNKLNLLDDEKLHLSGHLFASGLLNPYEALFGPWPLRLEGTIVLPATANDPPAMDLAAIAPSLRFKILNASLDNVGLNFVVVNDLDPEAWGWTSFSFINVVASLDVGSIHGEAMVALLTAGRKWRFLVDIDPPLGIGQSLTEVASLLGVSADVLITPPGFDDWSGFGIAQIEFLVAAPTASGIVPAVDNLAITLSSSKQWTPPIPFVQVRDVGTRWVVGWAPIGGQTAHYLSGSIYGTVRIGGDSPPRPRAVLSDSDPLSLGSPGFNVDIVAYIPRFVITGKLRTDDRIPIGDAFKYFFGQTGPPTKEGMAITAFMFLADPQARTYDASAVVTMDWEVPLLGSVSIVLQALRFRISALQGSITGAIVGQFALKGTSQDDAVVPQFYVGAEYTGSDSPEGWIFRGGLYPNTTVDLVRLVFNFLNVVPPASLPSVQLEALEAEFATTSKRYHVAGKIVGRWTPSLFGADLKISASATVDVQRAAGSQQAVGTLVGRFAINKIAVEAGMDLGVNEPTHTFRIEFGELWISAITGWHGTAPARHQTITIQLGGVTLGGILEYLVNLAAPTIGYKLEPPWDILNRIELSRFKLMIDPTDNLVELTYDANLDLTIMRIDKIGVRYLRSDGEPSVNLILYGQLLGKQYTDQPLAWDVVNDPPPSIGAGGETLLDVRYLGIGQRVTPRAAFPDSVRGSLDLLAQIMKQPENPALNPLRQPTGQGLVFAADSEWLIGIDLSLLDTIDLGIIFNDPRLYGLSIGLRGERAGSLAGLQFEILYKKITSDIGMFRIELRLPEAFRHFEFGEVSVTLGVIVVEIYTNGNFLIDLGFPYDRNYDRSFTVEVFPFIGRGGIYFGVLNGSTSRRVPRITNGTFAPVLELGIGLAVGVGKDISLGPLSGGIYVEVEAIFQGVFGWFNPSSSAVAPAKYYWAQCIAAIHGKLYGKIDFAIIKVSVTLEAYAQASVVFEAYKPAIFRLKVGVSVEAEVDILFVSVSFSFDADLDVSFTVGSESPTPWLIDTGQSQPTQRRLRGNIHPPLRQRPELRERLLVEQHRSNLKKGQLSETFTDDPCDSYALTWDPSLLVFTSSRPLALTMLPAFSLTQLPVSWGSAQPLNPNPQYRVAFVLFAANGVTPHVSRDERAQRSAALSAQATDVNNLSSDILIEALLRWSIAAVTGSPGNDSTKTVTAGQVATLLAQMECPQTRAAFSVTNLGQFLKTNAPVRISGDPGGLPQARGGMVFPMPPPISWTSPQAGNRNFAEDNQVGPWYEWGVASYLAPYFPQENVGPKPGDDPAEYESFATFVFRDYFLMIAKAAAQAARDTLRAWSIQLTADSTLANVADSFPTATVNYFVRTGDTVDSVAAALGATEAELEFLNPTLAHDLSIASLGMSLPIKLGVSPESVALDNAHLTLTSKLILNVGAVDYQAKAGDTLNGIAHHFHLGGAADLFNGSSIADDPLLLHAGATFPTPSVPYTPAANATTIIVAAIFYVRYYVPADIPNADWYAQTIFDLNKDGALSDVIGDEPIPPGRTLVVPAALNVPSRSAAIPYTTVVGDTVARIGAALSLAQNFAAGAAPSQTWTQFRDAVTTGAGTVVLPAASVTIQPRDTLNSLATRTIVNDTQPARLVGWLADSAVLEPLAIVTVPSVTGVSGRDGNTLQDIAAYYDLTVPDLGRRVATQIVFGSTQSLTIQSLAVQTIDSLVAQLLAGDAPREISATISRYLFSGLRLPAPEETDGHKTATGPLTSLYDLNGQQFPGPAPSVSGVALEVTVKVNQGTDWIELVGSNTIREDETYDALVARVPGAVDSGLNPALNDERVQPGMIVFTGVVNELVFSYMAEQLQYPEVGLALEPNSGPAAMRLAEKNPRTYGIDHRITLQTAATAQNGSPIPIPIVGDAPALGGASLWPFSSDFIARALAGSTVPYDILRNPHGQNGAAVDTIQSSTFATLLPFQVRRVAGQDHLYDVVGATAADRHLLLAIWQYLTKPATPAGTKGFFLVSPAPDAGNASGLANLLPDSAKTFIVKTNLSAETAIGAGGGRDASAAATSGEYYASFGDLAPFILLLWEGSVVGGAGYYLNLTTSDGNDIPASAFDDQATATLYLLVIAGEQQSPAPAGRTLLPINNCAAAAPGLDSSVHSLYIEAAQDDASELIPIAIVPPGNIGFRLTLPIPVTAAPEEKLRALFSLATYAIRPGGTFTMNPSGLPVGPQRGTAPHQPIWQRRRIERWQRLGRVTADNPLTYEWLFEQVLPVARFGPVSVLPLVSGLPDPADDPYRGIGGNSLASANIQLGFSDVLGNITALPTTPSGLVQADVGYTDPIAGVSNWPAVTLSYDVAAQADHSVMLTVTIAPQPAATAPAPGQSAALAIQAAALQAKKYREPYFQLLQPNVAVSIVTTLKPAPLVADVPTLWRFTAASYAAAGNAASVVPKTATGTLGDIITTYGVTYDDIASANAQTPVSSLFGAGPLVIPVFHTFADGDTANSIVQSLGQGWPTPGGGAALLQANATLPLRLKTVLTIHSAPLIVSSPAPTLAALAASLDTSAPLLARDSSDDRDVLQPNFTFTMDHLTVVVGQTTITPGETLVNTFSDVVAAFAAVGVNITIDDLGAAFADAKNMLVAGKTMHTAHYVAGDSDSLGHNGSGLTAAQLASTNAGTPDLFDAGAIVFLGTVTGSVSSSGLPETLRQFANRYACPPGQLLAANPTLAPPATTELIVPGTVTLPADTSLIRVPYSIGENESLNDVAAKFFAATAQTIGKANRYLAGTIADGKTISVGSFSTMTALNDSFQSIWQRLNLQSSAIEFGQVIDAIAGSGGYLAARGLLICPPAQTLAGGNLKPDQIAASYNVSAVAFAQANAGLLGIIAPGATLWNRDGNVSIVTGSNDTFNAITSRFAQQGVSLSTPEVIAKNHDVAFIKGGAMALLPAAPARLQVSLGTTVGPFESPIVPLTTAIRIQRPLAVISPAFRSETHDGPVERAQASVPAPARRPGEEADEDLSLREFVHAFQSALPNLRVATGKVAGHASDLWIVDFGPSGIAQVKVSRGVPRPQGQFWPRYFALRPLYNSLIQRQVQIQMLDEDGKLKPEIVPTNFQDIDVEVWSQRFLADLDLFLTVPYATAVYANDSAREALNQVLNAKKTLANAVARGLAETLIIPGDSKSAAGRNSAIESLEQQLKVSLSRAYNTSAMVQYDATVNSPWTRGAQLPPARLSGSGLPEELVINDGDVPGQKFPYTMEGAKTSLGQPSSFVNFLMRVPDPQHRGAVQVNLNYEYLDLEFNIATVGGVQGYESSDWLVFFDRLEKGVPAAVDTDLGVATIPIPLRNYPGVPTIFGQTARPTWCDTHPCDGAVAPPLGQTVLWTYGLSYAHEHADQDEVRVKVTFNVAPATLPDARAVTSNIADALAKYIAVADPLWEILSGFADAATTIPAVRLANAASTFATFVSNIATVWATHWPPGGEPRQASLTTPSDVPVEDVYSFRVKVSYAQFEGQTYFSTVQLTKDQLQPSPGGQWPVVFYVPPSGDTIKLTPNTPHADTLIYDFPQPKPAAIDWPHLTIEWPGISVAAKQNAHASLAVSRNARLLGEGNPDTALDFVFQTGSVEAADIVTPLLSWSQKIVLAGANPTQALQDAFTALFGTTRGLPLTISIFYGYTLVAESGGKEGITIYLPVTIYPNQLLTNDTAQAIAAALQRWDAVYKPTHEGGEWAFSLTLYSLLEAASTRPLLIIERMIYPIG